MTEGQGWLGSRRSAPRDTHIINLLDQVITVWRFDCMEVMVGFGHNCRWQAYGHRSSPLRGQTHQYIWIMYRRDLHRIAFPKVSCSYWGLETLNLEFVWTQWFAWVSILWCTTCAGLSWPYISRTLGMRLGWSRRVQTI